VRITEQHVNAALAKAGGVVRNGAHEPPTNGECKACIRELRALALMEAGSDIRWTDRPDGGSPTDRACIAINDGPWSSNEARTESCLPLVYLTEADATAGWVAHYALRTVREILPLALEAVGVDASACREARTLDESSAAAYAAGSAAGSSAACYAACYAAGYAAYTAQHAAGTAARAASSAAADAADAAADGDAVLRRAVDLLIECHG